MKVQQGKGFKASGTNQVDKYMQDLQHPLKKECEALRQVILSTDKEIGEEIKWNAPAFFYTGELKPSDPKEYRKYLIVFNLFKKDCIRLVFLGGAGVNDTSGLLEGDYADGRRLALFSSMDDVKSKEKDMRVVIKNWLKLLEK